MAVPFDANETVFWPPDFTPDTLIVPASCSKCGFVNLIEGDPQETQSVPRDMGSDVYYSTECSADCGNCGNSLSIEAELSVYANGCLFYDKREDECKLTAVFGLEKIIGDLCNARAIDEEEDIETWAEDPAGCAVFVEGPDDKAIIQEFLARLEDDDPSGIETHIFEGLAGGGRDRAVASAKYVSNISTQLRRRIPYVTVLDGDSYDWAQKQKDLDLDALFLLSKKEIESYLLDSAAIASVCKVRVDQVAHFLQSMSGSGKEQLERVLRKFKVRPRTEVKQLVARHLATVPDDFIKMRNKIRQRAMSS